MTLLIPLLVSLAAASAVLLAALGIVRLRAAASKTRALALVTGGALPDRVDGSSGASAVDALMSVGVALLERLGSATRLRRDLAYAGRAGTGALRRIAVMKLLGLVAGTILGLIVAGAVGGVSWIAVPGLAAAGFWTPDLLLVNAIEHRTLAVRRALPDAIDLLNLCVESGLGFQAALGQVAALQEGPVAEELSRVLREMQLGQSRQDALTALADRTKDEDLLRFIAAMAQVERLGIPIASVLREQAKDMRARRRDRARERAQKVPVKIMLPVVFCLFPLLVGIVIAPAAVQIARMFATM